MPPNGTTGKSSSTGARGPTGPQGQARTSPAGSGGGKAGSVSRTSSGARGPTGPQGQARSSPAGNAGGKAGATSRSAGNSRASTDTNAPTGRRGPTGPSGEAREPARNLVTGAGKRFGPMANNVVDIRKMQGPPKPPTVEQYTEDWADREQRRKMQQLDRYASEVGGQLAKTGAQYGAMKQAVIRNKIDAVATRNRNAQIRERNRDRSLSPMRDTVNRDLSRALPDTKLPSRVTAFDRVRTGVSNAIYGKPANRQPTVNRTGKTDRQPDMFKNGGLVSKKGRVPPKKGK